MFIYHCDLYKIARVPFVYRDKQIYIYIYNLCESLPKVYTSLHPDHMYVYAYTHTHTHEVRAKNAKPPGEAGARPAVFLPATTLQPLTHARIVGGPRYHRSLNAA